MPSRLPWRRGSGRRAAADLTRYLHGPILSVADIDEHAVLLRLLGLEERARGTLDAADVELRWGCRADGAEEALFATPGTAYGVRLVRFAPCSGVTIRHRDSGRDADAPKVVDFYVPDLERACAVLASAGCAVHPVIAEYEMSGQPFREAHLWVSDEIVFALIAGPPAFFQRFATVTDRMFSEPQSMSGSVLDLNASIDFFRDVFGLRAIHQFRFDHESFGRLVGTGGAPMELTAVNIGTATEAPYVALIHYGLPPGSQHSLAARARPPHRGVLGASIVVANAAEIEARARGTGYPVLASCAQVDIPGFGLSLSVLVQGPNGGCYQAIQPSTEE